MKYMGGKFKIAKQLTAIMKTYRQPNQCYIEPFVGGANVISHMDGWRIGADSHANLIKFYDALAKGYFPPENISEKLYNRMKQNPDNYDPLSGYAGFALSWGGKWFGRWARGKTNRNYVDEAYRALIKQKMNLVTVQWVCSTFDKLYVPKNSLIYCDPPYAGTTRYTSDFDTKVFWEWVDKQANLGHTLFVSEYHAPDFMKVV
jgi:DNA adenine methylase